MGVDVFGACTSVCVTSASHSRDDQNMGPAAARSFSPTTGAKRRLENNVENASVPVPPKNPTDSGRREIIAPMWILFAVGSLAKAA